MHALGFLGFSTLYHSSVEHPQLSLLLLQHKYSKQILAIDDDIVPSSRFVAATKGKQQGGVLLVGSVED